MELSNDLNEMQHQLWELEANIRMAVKKAIGNHGCITTPPGVSIHKITVDFCKNTNNLQAKDKFDVGFPHVSISLT